MKEPRRFIQVVAGPRQAGKTTLVQQVTDESGFPVRYASADEPTLRGEEWVGQQWEAARLSFGRRRGVLVLDEVQKAANWAESVKRLWDEDTRARRRGSSPKLQVLNTALMTAQSGISVEEMRGDPESWGRLVESAVGAHLANAAAAGGCEVYYWRERNREVDFVVRAGRRLTAIEVKSGKAPHALPGITAFTRAFKPWRSLLVGGDGIPLDEFLLRPVSHWVKP